ncbi:uncharacterized protein [Prorops nasuta]|uniref:uncharacterized protein n=1 Tax=Prorops nasuta TaxID=863751 RepID=UPI0034CE092B
MFRFGKSLIALCILGGVFAQNCENKEGTCPETEKIFNQDADWLKADSIYDFSARDIHGKEVSLKKYQGHPLIIVNVASNCTLTDSNYKQLVQLYEKYSNSKGLRIAAFPSNQFAGQEPGTSEEILNFVKGYNVKFDMYEKINVNGDDALPLWKWLKSQKNGEGFITNAIKWNFTKFIINKEGKVVARFAPNTEPLEMEPTLNLYL